MNRQNRGSFLPRRFCYSDLTVELFDFVDCEEEDFTALPAVRLSWFAQGQSVVTSSASAKELVTTKIRAIKSFILTPCEKSMIHTLLSKGDAKPCIRKPVKQCRWVSKVLTGENI